MLSWGKYLLATRKHDTIWRQRQGVSFRGLLTRWRARRWSLNSSLSLTSNPDCLERRSTVKSSPDLRVCWAPTDGASVWLGATTILLHAGLFKSFSSFHPTPMLDIPWRLQPFSVTLLFLCKSLIRIWLDVMKVSDENFSTLSCLLDVNDCGVENWAWKLCGKFSTVCMRAELTLGNLWW